MKNHRVTVKQISATHYNVYAKNGHLLIFESVTPFRSTAQLLLENGQAQPNDSLTCELDGDASYKILPAKVGKLAGA
jgi:hypothetical protein